MNEAMKPILFCTTMVQATLKEIKTNTRRICNIPDGWEYDGYGRITSYHPKKGKWGAIIRKGVGTDFPEVDIVPAKYQIGDILYVRETFVIEGMCFNEDGTITHHEEPIVHYKADGEELTWFDEWEDEVNVPWKPSIHMNKELARIFLRVTNVRVERLQDISVEDILKEGAPLITITVNNEDFINSKLKGWWYDLWTSINGKGAWEENPFVFVYEFQRIEKPC